MKATRKPTKGKGKASSLPKALSKKKAAAATKAPSQAASKGTAKKAVKSKAAPKAAVKAKAPAVKANAAPVAKPKTLTKKEVTPKAKKSVKTRVRSVATLKRAGLMRGGSKKRPMQSAPETLVSAQLEKLAGKWELLHAKVKSIPTETYNMRKQFERQTGLQHKILGWGFIIENKNDRLEVLFQDGIRYLISNYR